MCLNHDSELHCKTRSTVLTVNVLSLSPVMLRIYCLDMQKRLTMKISQVAYFFIFLLVMYKPVKVELTSKVVEMDVELCAVSG